KVHGFTLSSSRNLSLPRRDSAFLAGKRKGMALPLRLHFQLSSSPPRLPYSTRRPPITPQNPLHFAPTSLRTPKLSTHNNPLNSGRLRPLHASAAVFSPQPEQLLSTDDDSLSRTLRSFSRIKPYVLSQQKCILLGWLCSLLSVVSLSQVVARFGRFSSCIGKMDMTMMISEGSVLGAFFLAKLIATYLQQAMLWEASLKAVCEMRGDVFRGVLGRELGYFEGGSGVSSGDIAHRITDEAEDVADTIYALLNVRRKICSGLNASFSLYEQTIVPGAMQLSAMAMQMLVISPALSTISAMVVPCTSLAIAYLGERMRKISKDAHLSVANVSAYLNEVLPAILFVKANNAELCESVRFQRLADADLLAHLKKKKMKALTPQIVQIIYFGGLFTLCVGSLVVSKGCFDSCNVVSFMTSLVFLVEPIQDFGKAFNEWKQGEPAIERLFDLANFKSKVIEKQDAIELKSVKGDVKFYDVSFKYGDDRPLILNKLNLHIQAGETVALIGPSGGGKTTLVKLLLRLYDPLSGGILLDNRNIQNIHLESLRKHVGLVSQDVTIFSGTIAENIGYQDLTSEIDMEKVKMAARNANADEFIRMLPNGYETSVGPRGSSLSGGQKQRLAIARAIYQDAAILILDEATSALDSKSELLVRQALERLTKNHTVLVIAHRLETVLMANRILLLDKGELQEISRSSIMNGNRTSMESNEIVI
ncbi:ABC transporter B family member 29, chloroplastic, partial [Linum perenne]